MLTHDSSGTREDFVKAWRQAPSSTIHPVNGWFSIGCAVVVIVFTSSAANALGSFAMAGQLFPAKGSPILLSKPAMILGRAAGCDIVINEKVVSNRLCM